MIIAVNTRLEKEGQPAGYENFLFGILDRLTKKYTQHKFIFICDKPDDNSHSFPGNVQIVVTGPETKTNLRIQYWFNYKVPAVLQKYKADVFVSLEGICSMRTKKPQCLLISDIGFLLHTGSGKKSNINFYKRKIGRSIAKANAVATISDPCKQVLADHYKFDEAIEVIRPGVDELFKPMDWNEKESIREKYAEGKAYFLFSGDTGHRSNLLNLLKAFSFFKKRQKSNMLVLIAGHVNAHFKKELKTYKYRQEVLLLENLEKKELAKVIAAAYAMIHPVLYDDLALPVLQAMRSDVPVVASAVGSLPAICGTAALYCDPADVNSIAENMMLVFKDEQKAASLILAGKAVMQQYSWENSADQLMALIDKAATK